MSSVFACLVVECFVCLVFTLFRLGIGDLQIKVSRLAQSLLVEDGLLQVVHANVQPIERDRVVLERTFELVVNRHDAGSPPAEESERVPNTDAALPSVGRRKRGRSVRFVVVVVERGERFLFGWGGGGETKKGA